MVPMIAKKSFVYAGKRLAVGAKFSARSAQDAKLLRAICNAEMDNEPAEVAPPVAETVKRQYVRKVVEAELVVGGGSISPVDGRELAESMAEKPKRQYRRRDMAAE